ncbi:LysR substrate-binding domain-containing protein [Rubrivirga sp. IMCC43871]|uniref:LysR substrate-binding domain-containing protein n=1 Tax=Rubrivirga sp. IMCC43871 TaxID=3391575 RepID=UPI0039902FFA
MTLAQLRYAVAVDTHRHFARAAAACFVSQPTLSAGLKRLEDELGTVLFDRSRQPTVPTAAGTRVIAHARAVLREADALAAAADGPADEPAGELRVGVIPTLASCLLPVVAGPFAARFPRARLTLVELTTDAILDHLATERIDAALVATDERRAGLRSERLFSEAFVAYVGPGHPLAAQAEVDPATLAPDDVWLLSEGHCFRDQVLDLCGAAPSGPDRRVRFESGSLETLRRMADRTGGITLLTELTTRYLTGAEAARVRPLVAPAPRREVRLLTVRAHIKEALVAAFAETVRETVAEVLG